VHNVQDAGVLQHQMQQISPPSFTKKNTQQPGPAARRNTLTAKQLATWNSTEIFFVKPLQEACLCSLMARHACCAGPHACSTKIDAYIFFACLSWRVSFETKTVQAIPIIHSSCGHFRICANPDFRSPAKPGAKETFQPGHVARFYEVGTAIKSQCALLSGKSPFKIDSTACCFEMLRM